MKTLLVALLAVGSLTAQAVPTTVTVTVAVDSKTYSLQLTAAGIASLSQYLSASNATSPTISPLSLLLSAVANQQATPSPAPYADCGDLIVKHILMLLGPLVLKYPPAAVTQANAAVVAAQSALQQAVSSAAAGTITVTGN